MNGGKDGRSPASPAVSGGSLDLIYTNKGSNPHQDSLSGRFAAGLQAKIEAGAPFGCDRCETTCDARIGCRLYVTPDQLAGIKWWNGLTEEDRRFWLAAAVSFVPAQAWEAFKLARGLDAKYTP